MAVGRLIAGHGCGPLTQERPDQPWVKVTCDGQPLEHVYELDDEQGWANIASVHWQTGEPVPAPDSYYGVELLRTTGKIEVQFQNMPTGAPTDMGGPSTMSYQVGTPVPRIEGITLDAPMRPFRERHPRWGSEVRDSSPPPMPDGFMVDESLPRLGQVELDLTPEQRAVNDEVAALYEIGRACPPIPLYPTPEPEAEDPTVPRYGSGHARQPIDLPKMSPSIWGSIELGVLGQSDPRAHEAALAAQVQETLARHPHNPNGCRCTDCGQAWLEACLAKNPPEPTIALPEVALPEVSPPPLGDD